MGTRNKEQVGETRHKHQRRGLLRVVRLRVVRGRSSCRCPIKMLLLVLMSCPAQCDTQLLIFEHVAKSGGTMLTRQLPEQLQIPACYPKFHGTGAEGGKMAEQLVQNYSCGACGLAAAEWHYSDLAGRGVLNLTSRVRLFTFVRDPLMWFVSKVQHDIRNPATRYNDLDDALNQAENRSSTSYGARILYNFQSRHLGMTRVPPVQTRNHLRRTYMFVGITEWMWHSLCALDFHLQRFDARRCNCSSTLTTTRANEAPKSQQDSISVTAAQSKRALALLQMDVVLHAAALQNLVDDLQRIQLERNIDLLSCFYQGT